MSQNDANSLLDTACLSIGYGEKGPAKTLASGLDLTLHAGEFICLLGPNGAGKTTLLRTLSGILTPLAGSIRLLGTDLSAIPTRERAHRISVVLADKVPAGMMNARSLVALGRHPYSGWLGRLDTKDYECIEWALQIVGASQLAERLVAELSDGERQKVAIARALAQEASILLLDEPTAHLDLPNRIETMALLRRLSREKNLAVLLSTHDLDLALRQADRLWLLGTDGTLRQGEPEALARSGALAETFAHESLQWNALQTCFNQPKPDGQSGQVPE